MEDFFLDQTNVVKRLVDDWKAYGESFVIAYDFDNTVFDYHSQGIEFNDVIDLLNKCKKFGATLIVYTASEDEKIPFIREYLLENDIPFDYINEQPEDIPVHGKKLFFNILLDDRAGLKSAYEALSMAYMIMSKEISTEVPNGYVLITPEEYDTLLEDSAFLNCLRNAGVDNWDGYSYAYELMDEEE